MKKLILIAFLLITSFASAQNPLNSLPEIDGKVFFAETTKVSNLSKENIFQLTKEWMLYNSKAPLQTEDIENGLLISNGSVLCIVKKSMFSSPKYQFDFKVKVECKNDSYIVNLYDITYRNAEGKTDFVDPIEKYNGQLKKSNDKTTENNVIAIMLQFGTVFKTLHDRIFSYENYAIPSASDLGFRDLLTKEFDYKERQTTYQSSLSESIWIERYIDPDVTFTKLYFNFYKNHQDYNDQTITVTFNDGTTTNFTTKGNTGTKLIGQNYSFLAGLDLNQGNIQNFKQKKISKFQVGKRDFIIDDSLATKIQSWVNCVENLY